MLKQIIKIGSISYTRYDGEAKQLMSEHLKYELLLSPGKTRTMKMNLRGVKEANRKK